MSNETIEVRIGVVVDESGAVKASAANEFNTEAAMFDELNFDFDGCARESIVVARVPTPKSPVEIAGEVETRE